MIIVGVLYKNSIKNVTIFSTIPKYRASFGFGTAAADLPPLLFIKNATYKINHAKIQYENRKSTGI